jgi:hypothetical protein
VKPGTPERLTRWQLSGLSLDHPAQVDIAWAADHIADLRDLLRDACDYIEADSSDQPYELLRDARIVLEGLLLTVESPKP